MYVLTQLNEHLPAPLDADTAMKARTERQSSRRVLAIVAVCWLLGGAAGMAGLLLYSSTPGSDGRAARRWPTGSRIPHDPQRATLLMFVHPQCPCSRSSLGELEKLVAHCRQKVTPWVVFFHPHGATDAWVQSTLWQSALNIPGTQLLADDDGVEATRFGVATSGQTLLYGTDGKLLFSGGITSARGHAGDNAGREALERLLNGARPAQETTPTFGCPILTGSGNSQVNSNRHE